MVLLHTNLRIGLNIPINIINTHKYLQLIFQEVQAYVDHKNKHESALEKEISIL